MLSFSVFENGVPARQFDVAGAYVVGTDDVALRADITFEDGIIHCDKRAPGPAGLAIMWPTDGAGTLLLDTVRLLERMKPYVLSVELARGRLLRINQKLEDWGLQDFVGIEPIGEQITEARATLIQALMADAPAQASVLGAKALASALQASEALAQYHAQALPPRRRAGSGATRALLGCSVGHLAPTEPQLQRLAGAFDFINLRAIWRDIEPREQQFNWKPLDAWVEAAVKRRIPIKMSSLLSFTERDVPDWLYIWEHDFDTMRDLAAEHLRRVVSRYAQYVHAWDAISGIHANCCFAFTFEQLLELTRMATALVRKTAPRATSLVNLVGPWGEYYAANQKTIPPMLFAEMVVQGQVDFDGFGLECPFGPPLEGMYVRDLFQVASLLDAFSKLGKPIHMTSVQVPAAPVDADDPAAGGMWLAPWSERCQAEWTRRFLQIASSRPFVESVVWRSLTDNADDDIPSGGLLRGDLSPRLAYGEFAKMRADQGK